MVAATALKVSKALFAFSTLPVKPTNRVLTASNFADAPTKVPTALTAALIAKVYNRTLLRTKAILFLIPEACLPALWLPLPNLSIAPLALFN